MAKGVGIFGKVDKAYWENEIKNAKTAADARTLLDDIMSASYAGTLNWGITKNDQKTISGLIKTLGKKFNVDTSDIEKMWDPNIDLKSKNSETIKTNSLNMWDKQVKINQNKQAQVKTQQQVEQARNTNTEATLNKLVDNYTNTIANTVKRSTSSGGSGGSSKSKSNDSYFENELAKVKKELESLKKPTVWTSDELAKLYGLEDQYNYDNILNQYNDATNQYYNDAITQQTEYNEDADIASAAYANNLIRKYVDSYKAQAPTAVGRGTLAANALTSAMNADQTLGETATNLNNIINDYKAQRESELANNPTLARNQYNSLGKYLLQQGADKAATEVQRYIDTLNAYKEEYQAIRNAQTTVANNAAAAYQNRAQAALATMNYQNDNALWNVYKSIYGDNAALAYRNDKSMGSINYNNTNYNQRY